MEHVRTFLFSKIFSTKERRFVFSTGPETAGEGSEAADVDPGEQSDTIIDQMIEGMTPEQKQALIKRLQESLVGSDEEVSASQKIEAKAGDAALELNAALEMGDSDGVDRAKQSIDAALNEMVMGGEVNGDDIREWLKEAFPTFDVSYDDADMVPVLPSLIMPVEGGGADRKSVV